MKKWKKIVLILSTVAVLFVSLFAFSASAAKIYGYAQLDPQTTLMSVDSDGNIVNQGLLALPSTIVPPINTTGVYQTYGDFSTVKYRWQLWPKDVFGVHSVSNHKTWIYQDYNYLDVRGVSSGAYDITVSGYFGHYDGNMGVYEDYISNSADLLTIIFEIISTDGGADYKYSFHSVKFNGNGPSFTLSSYLRSLGYLGVSDSQRVYLKNLYVECGSSNWGMYSGVEDYGFETIIKLYTNNGKYWQEYGLGERSSFDPSMQVILDNFYNTGYSDGVIAGEEIGYNNGYNTCYDGMISEIETITQQRDEAREGLSNSNLVLNFFQGIYEAVNGVLHTFFELDVFGFSLGSVVATFVIALVVIFIIKIIK